MRRLRVVAIVAGLVGTAATTACQPAWQARRASPTVTITRSASPAPTITVLKSAQTVAAGTTASFVAQDGVSMRLTASRPKVSRSRLSSSYGYAPARGYYVTFMLTIANTGSQPVQIGPSNFVLRVPGEGRVSSYDGNAPYSGASAQLDTTAVDPQQRVRAPITFDVRRPHGTLSFVPDRSAAIIWRF